MVRHHSETLDAAPIRDQHICAGTPVQRPRRVPRWLGCSTTTDRGQRAVENVTCEPSAGGFDGEQVLETATGGRRGGDRRGGASWGEGRGVEEVELGDHRTRTRRLRGGGTDQAKAWRRRGAR